MKKFLVSSWAENEKSRTNEADFANMIMMDSLVICLLSIIWSIGEERIPLPPLAIGLFWFSFLPYWMYRKKGKRFRRALLESVLSPLVLGPFLIILGVVNLVVLLVIIVVGIGRLVKKRHSLWAKIRPELRPIASELLQGAIEIFGDFWRKLGYPVLKVANLIRRFFNLFKENPVMNGH